VDSAAAVAHLVGAVQAEVGKKNFEFSILN